MTQVSTEKRGKSVRQSISPQFLVRIGGLPITVVDALCFEQATERVEQLLSLEQKLAERKDRLVDVLYEAVNKHRDEVALRRKLINLKRDIFNLHMLDALSEKRALAMTLSSPERELLLEWLDLWAAYQSLLADGPALFARELLEKRALLKQTINTPHFRKGVTLASPALDDSVEAYLSGDNRHLNRNARTTERSLCEYLLRTACKTSPFSTFTSVCPGTFGTHAEQDAPAIGYQVNEMTQRSFTTVNVALLSKLSAALLHSDILRKDMPVQLTTGWHMQDNRIRYLRRAGLDNGDEENSVISSVVHEDVFSLPVGRLLTSLLELLSNGRKMRLGEISVQLRIIPEYATSGEEIDAYLDHLLRLGLLIVPDLQLNLHSARPITDYCRGLHALNIRAADTLACDLEHIEALIDGYAEASHSERRRLMEEIKQQVRHCFHELGQADVALPRTLVYEDTTLHLPELVANEVFWHEAISNMAEFQQILSVFDINLERKIVTRGYFRARYGAGQRCDDFLTFASEFRQNFFEPYLHGLRTNSGEARRANHFQQPELDHLYEAQQVVAESMRQATAQLPTGSVQMFLDENLVKAIIPYVPVDNTHLASNTFFSQCAVVSGEPLIIVNRIYTGFTQTFSRFAHYFPEEEGYQLLPMLRTTLERVSPPDAVFAELKGGYDTTNLNLHPQVTAYELVCPGDISTRVPEEQIPLDDLFILDNENAGGLQLYSKRLGKRVIPLYLGFLLPTSLPEMQQVLLNFSYTPMCLLDFWKDSPPQASDETLVFYPRLRYKNLVLHRAQWQIPVAALPRRASGQSDFEVFLNVNRWRRAQGLPRRGFVTPARSFNAPKTPSGEEGETDQQMRNYKPLYVDFTNLFSVLLLETLARDSAQPLIFAEMLPDQDQLWLKHQGQSYVSEFVLEMNTVKGGANDSNLD